MTTIRELLDSFRIVLLGGARQTGKTTLVRDLLDLSEQAWFSQVLPPSDRVWAVPVSALWRADR